MKPSVRRLVGISSLFLASAVWLPVVHFLFQENTAQLITTSSISPKAQALAARHLQLWIDPMLRKHELDRMRRSNAEWDFMGRSFLVWSFAEMALRDPSRKLELLSVMDKIISETLQLEQERGVYFFLMPYAKARPYVVQPVRSLFVDGEIALMLAVRQFVESREDFRLLLSTRIKIILDELQRNPALVAESYPNECWLFDHLIALAAIRIADHLDGGDHSTFLRQWIAMAKKKFVHSQTGLLVSNFTTEGRPMEGPEGSTIWAAAYFLKLLDEDFAAEQYRRARTELGVTVQGFGYSREWPKSWRGLDDIDSGVVIPGLDVSAGGSGLALIGAAAFGDFDFLRQLHTTLEFAAFPKRDGARLKYCASNQVGDAVMLYSTVLGPIWQQMKEAKRWLQAPFFSARGYVSRAVLISLVFAVCHFLGWREHTTFLSGSTASPDTSIKTSGTMGVVYMLTYFGFVLAVPILLIGAGLVSFFERFFTPTNLPPS